MINILYQIATIGFNRELGYKGDTIFKHREDRTFFNERVKNKIVVIGRKTYESLKGKPLKDCEVWVLTKQEDLKVIHTNEKTIKIEDILKEIDTPRKVFVVGGEELFNLFLPFTKRIYLTQVIMDDESQGRIKGDVFFPQLSEEEWVGGMIDEVTSQKYEDTLLFLRYSRREWLNYEVSK